MNKVGSSFIRLAPQAGFILPILSVISFLEDLNHQVLEMSVQCYLWIFWIFLKFHLLNVPPSVTVTYGFSVEPYPENFVSFFPRKKNTKKTKL